jgi:hypothetical protein
MGSSIATKRPGDEELGLRIQEWSTKKGDALHNLGLTLASQTLTVADSAKSAELVRKVVWDLHFESALQRDRAFYDPTTPSERRPEHASLFNELVALRDDVSRRFADLLAAYPEQ